MDSKVKKMNLYKADEWACYKECEINDYKLRLKGTEEQRMIIVEDDFIYKLRICTDKEADKMISFNKLKKNGWKISKRNYAWLRYIFNLPILCDYLGLDRKSIFVSRSGLERILQSPLGFIMICKTVFTLDNGYRKYVVHDEEIRKFCEENSDEEIEVIWKYLSQAIRAYKAGEKENKFDLVQLRNIKIFLFDLLEEDNVINEEEQGEEVEELDAEEIEALEEDNVINEEGQEEEVQERVKKLDAEEIKYLQEFKTDLHNKMYIKWAYKELRNEREFCKLPAEKKKQIFNEMIDICVLAEEKLKAKDQEVCFEHKIKNEENWIKFPQYMSSIIVGLNESYDLLSDILWKESSYKMEKKENMGRFKKKEEEEAIIKQERYGLRFSDTPEREWKLYLNIQDYVSYKYSDFFSLGKQEKEYGKNYYYFCVSVISKISKERTHNYKMYARYMFEKIFVLYLSQSIAEEILKLPEERIPQDKEELKKSIIEGFLGETIDKIFELPGVFGRIRLVKYIFAEYIQIYENETFNGYMEDNVFKEIDSYVESYKLLEKNRRDSILYSETKSIPWDDNWEKMVNTATYEEFIGYYDEILDKMKDKDVKQAAEDLYNEMSEEQQEIVSWVIFRHFNYEKNLKLDIELVE